MSNLSELLPAGSGAKVAEFVASGTLASGQTVALKADGTVEAVSSTAPVAGTLATLTSDTLINYGLTSAYDATNNIVVVAYANSGGVYGQAGVVSGSSITWQGQNVIMSGNGGKISVVHDANNGRFLFVYYTNTNSGQLYMRTALVGDGAWSNGTQVTLNAGNYPYQMVLVYDPVAQKSLVAYGDQSNSQYGTAKVLTISGGNVSAGTDVVYSSEATQNDSAVYAANAGACVIACIPQSSSVLKSAVGVISGTSVTFSTPVTFNTTTPRSWGNGPVTTLAYDATAERVIYANSQADGCYAYAGLVASSGVTWGAKTSITSAASGTGATTVVYNSTTKVTSVLFAQNSTSYLESTDLAISGSVITPSAITTLSSTPVEAITAVYNSTLQKVVSVFRQSSTLLKALTYVNGSTNNTSFIGITNAAISSAATGEVAVQGGVITNTNLNVATAITAGSKVVFDDGGPTTGIALAYDPDTAKVVNVFCTTNVQGIVGTVSGTSISYGSASSANSNSSSDAQVAYDTVNNKIVAVYKEGFNDARVVIGTVSGTAISWGTPVVFASVNAATPNVAFDTNAGKVLIVYKDQANNNYGKAVVGTVSGTSISIGSPVTFMNANANKIELVYDANAQKSVLVVQDASNNIGVAYVATISGTSVSFGSPTNFLSSALTANALAITYNSTDNKVIVGFSKGSDNKGYLTTGTVSGTSISFAGETEFSGSTTTNYISLSYKASGNVLGMAYNIGGATTVKFNAAVISGTSFSFGTEQELTAGATDITATTVDLASGNFVASYGDGSNNYDGTTNVISVATTLATGTDYYVQTDGTLNTTVTTVPAGRALSATSILLEG